MSDDTRKKALAFLKARKVAVVATVNEPEFRPEAATIHYFVDDNFNIYFLTRRDTRKYKNMMTRPQVALVVGTSEDYETAQIEGLSRIVETDHEIADFFQALNAHPELYNLYFGTIGRREVLPKAQELDVAIIKVNVQWVRWMEFDPMTKKDKYEELITRT